jgi:DNA-binding response OmpR family regulator
MIPDIRGNMPSSAMRILAIGVDSLGTGPMLAALATRGWGSRSVGTLREARELLRTFRFDIVLAGESLPDGQGYELIDTIARHEGTLLIGVALSESCLWLPVLQRGTNVFGKRAFNADLIESEVELLLREPDAEPVREINRHDRLGTVRPGLHHALSPQGRSVAAASGRLATPEPLSPRTKQHTAGMRPARQPE